MVHAFEHKIKLSTYVSRDVAFRASNIINGFMWLKVSGTSIVQYIKRFTDTSGPYGSF